MGSVRNQPFALTVQVHGQYRRGKMGDLQDCALNRCVKFKLAVVNHIPSVKRQPLGHPIPEGKHLRWALQNNMGSFHPHAEAAQEITPFHIGAAPERNIDQDLVFPGLQIGNGNCLDRFVDEVSIHNCLNPPAVDIDSSPFRLFHCQLGIGHWDLGLDRKAQPQ